MNVKKNLWFLMLLFLMGMVLNGCDGNKDVEGNQRIGELEAQVAQLQEENRQLAQERDQALSTTEVTLYFITSTPTDLYLVPVKKRVSKEGDLGKNAMEALIAGAPETNLISPLPKTTRLLGYEVKQGTAFVNFSRDVMNFGGGSDREALTLGAIVNTLTEYPDIHQVQILVEGQKIESLGGHVETDLPLKRDLSAVEPGAKQ